MAVAIVLMGVSGSGKTAVGQHLAEILNWPFFDGDDFHPAENISKMSKGIPLQDSDRGAWLSNLQVLLTEEFKKDRPVILAASALKQKYREQLGKVHPNLTFVYLKGSHDLISSRMHERENHFMKEAMLESQFNTLEEPAGAVVVNIDQSIEEIAAEIIRRFELDQRS